MAKPASDTNLLFGVLALQMDFITREQLVAAMQAWVFDKKKPLGEILCAQKALAADNRELLEALMVKHLAKHDNDPEKSLAAVSSISDVKKDLEQITDTDVQASLVHVSPAGPHDYDAYATIAPSASGSDVYGTVAPSATASSSMASRFRILRPHARGGLGQVSVAHDEELHREVALKEILPRAADNEESRARFLLEAEITGGLEHPGIVPVYGLGTYADGRPYYAMRFIRGDSLKEAIDRFFKADAAGMDAGKRTLELRGMLGRFVDVCNAIAYAHSRGILHRDLKPGNIMLGKYGETLVVDWGLAKPVGDQGPSEKTERLEPGEGSLTPRSMSASSQTMMGSAVGTPQYMSPEQAGGKLDQLGPASDVYSLGATLYVILTGKPSVTDPDVGVVLQKVQRGEITRPREIKPEVPAPLEAICLKAMMLKPEDRYASPRLMADDIEHWLADEPVSAWPEPWTVKARRWLGRHRTLVTGVVASVAVALVGLIIATVLLTAANERERLAKEDERKAKEFAQDQEKIAVQQKELAEKNFQLARKAVDRYHTEVSEDILLDQPGMQPLRKKLLEAAREFYAKFVQERGNDMAMRADLGRATFRLAQITGVIDSELDAIKLHQQAIKLFEQVPAGHADAETQNDVAATWYNLARLYRKTLQKEKAKEAGEKSLALWEQLAKAKPRNDRIEAGLARTENGLGNIYQVLRELDPAQKFYEQSLEKRKTLVKDHPKVAEYQRDLAISYRNLGQLWMAQPGKKAEAEKAYRAAMAIWTQLIDDAPNVSTYQNDLAAAHYLLADMNNQMNPPPEKDYEAAAKLWLGLVERNPAVMEFSDHLADAYTALAALYRRAKDPKKAEEICEQALKITRKLAAINAGMPSYQGGVAKALVALGDAARANQQPDKAQAAYDEAVQIQEKLANDPKMPPNYRSELVSIYNRLGAFQEDTKKAANAEDSYKKALSWAEKLVKQFPKEKEYGIRLSETFLNLGNRSRTAGNLKEAADWYTRALESAEPQDAKKPRDGAVKLAMYSAYVMRADTLTQMKRYGDALTDMNRALELASAPRPIVQLARMALLARTGKYTEAVAEADKMLEMARDSGPGLYRLAAIYALSAAAVTADDQRPQAERQKLSDQYATQAVKLLADADTAKFFQTPANREKLQSDPDLQSLRARADFKKLVSEMKAK